MSPIFRSVAAQREVEIKYLREQQADTKLERQDQLGRLNQLTSLNTNLSKDLTAEKASNAALQKSLDDLQEELEQTKEDESARRKV